MRAPSTEPDLFVRAAAMVDFLELAARACQAPDFALRHAQRLPLGILGQGWMIMRAADSVGAALRDFAALYGICTDAGSLAMHKDGNDAWLRYDFLPIGRWGERQIIHLTLGCIRLFVAAGLARPACHRVCCCATCLVTRGPTWNSSAMACASARTATRCWSTGAP
ncbi:MAG: AraC family transcriptional regulator ligand-binding domain-containing protein [Proteobacteria bacterium]|nr:AraC family transcriptional regulator ligand-binding domain-containing protein [Pseudomonadota bacterium]